MKGIYPALRSGLLGEATSGDVLGQSHLPHSSQLRPAARRFYLYLNLGQCYRFIKAPGLSISENQGAKSRERNPEVREPPNLLLRWDVSKDKEQRAGTG